MNRKDLIYNVKQSVKSFDPEARVILFGSRARGDNDKTSDWDFLVLTSKQIDEPGKREIRDSLIDTELEAEEVISTIIFSQDMWNNYSVTPLYQNISKDGIEL
ncbi:MAG: nucleotidyltransferase domain-containing protein [Bacteroidales bacterium]|nr:nucleotidyltransferase domain-containing protein [Bacteroidales bacterium]MBN2818959.1 nucleotidyltransferase domain-containing protein [Bacteroidales bacterium]